MNKEIKKIYDIKVIDHPLGIENRLELLSEKIAGSIELGKMRLVMLKKSIDEKFPPNSPERGALDGFTAVTFDTAFELFFTGNNSP
jgi:hypothetical protein